ncbi:MAG: cyanoexosortase C [Leptolyngbya sp. SIO3F4]|nr:cyanoexosortase C [Leptolyngbya sp. SIO3F4]
MTKRLSHIQLQQFLQWCLSSCHGRVISIGLIAGFIYLPTYARVLVRGITGGHSTIILNLGFLYLGVERLWSHRENLNKTRVLTDDRLIGYCILLGAALWLPFSLNSVSIQAFLWMLILIGIAWSSFSPRFFWRFPLASMFILIGMYPNYVWLSNRVLRVFTGPYLLENLMAWLGSLALGVIGYTPEVQGRFLVFPEGAVEVAGGCTGFDMAVVLAGISFLWGIFVKTHWQRIAIAVIVGIAIAFSLNIPRIVLLAFAAVYWGQESFDFWHGLWGGQIFSCIMFTAYYYAAMAIFNKKSSPSKIGST